MKKVSGMKGKGSKRALGALIATTVVVTSAAALIGCTVPLKPVGQYDKALKAKEVYSMSAVTSMQALADNKAPARKVSFGTVADTITARPGEITDDIMDTLSKFMGMFEGMLMGTGGGSTETVPTPELDGEYANYKTKIVMSMPSLDGVPVEYTMYYTEVTEGETLPEVTDPVAPVNEDVDGEDADTDADADADAEEEGEEEEVEVSTKLVGVVVMGDVVTEIAGTKTVETEGTEVETEVEFTTKIDENNYVTVKEEKEAGEIEYEYTIVTDGVEEVTSIEYENEAGKEELSLELEANGVEKEFSVEVVEKDGIKVFEVSYQDEDAGTEVDIIATPIGDGTYEFRFENGHIEIK